jgi:hypothetical protein
VAIHHPKNRGGVALEPVRDVTFVTFGLAPGLTHVQGVVTDANGAQLHASKVETLLHPSEGYALFGKYFWAIRIYDVDSSQAPYTIAVKNGDDPASAAMYTVAGVTFAIHKAAAGPDPTITYPLSSDQVCTTFASYGRASPGGTPGGHMTAGPTPADGTNPVPGTSWVVYFNITTAGTYNLDINVSGVTATNSPQNGIHVVSAGCN